MDWLIRLKEMKQASGFTTKQIALGSGIPEPTLEKLFAGATKEPKLATMQQLVHFLGYTLDDLTPMEQTKKSPAPAEPETGDIDDYEDDLFYQALIADGRVREGEDITSAQLRIFASVLEIIDAAFPKLSDVQRDKTSKTG